MSASRPKEVPQLADQQLGLLQPREVAARAGISVQRSMLAYTRSAHDLGTRRTSFGKIAHPVGTRIGGAVDTRLRVSSARS